MAEKSPPGPKPISDVAHPDKTAAEPSSKPLLVTNRPIMKDPMMVTEDPAAGQEMPQTEAARAARPLKTVAPPQPQKAEEPEKPEPSDEPEAPAAAESEEDSDKPAEAAEADPEAEAAGLEAEQAEHDAAIQKLAESKKYSLPINSLERRRSQRFVLLGIIISLVLAVAWADVALDAGLIHTKKVKPVTHFFSN